MYRTIFAAMLAFAAATPAEAEIKAPSPSNRLPTAPICKSVDSTVGPGQTLLGRKCNWKYGCRCFGQECRTVNGAIQYKGVNCINLPG